MRALKVAMLLLWAGSGYANPEITVDLPGGATMEMVWIEPGTFTMGSPGKVPESPDIPATFLSWNDLQVFVHTLTVATGDSLYRLPTEAEWEYACRAGTTARWSFGDDESLLKDYAWYRDNAWGAGEDYVHQVGLKIPNPWGLYDMHGNVWEWVQDRYGVDYSSISQTDPTGPATGSQRVTRGGSFHETAEFTRSAFRLTVDTPVEHRDYLGARLLRMGPAPTSVTPQSWGEVNGESR